MSPTDGAGAYSTETHNSPGTCFGFAVSSALGFKYLRNGEGEPLTIVESAAEPEGTEHAPVLEWSPTPAIPWHARLYDDGTRFRLWIESGGWFVVEPSLSRITIPSHDDHVRREERLWGLPAILTFLERGDLPLHAAAVEIEGGAVILGAPGRFGKTTLAAAFVSAGYRLLSEDVTCVRLTERPVAIPGPAMLRVRQDVADSVATNNVSVTLEAQEPEARVHFSIDPSLRGDCNPVPIRGIVLLRVIDDRVWLEPVDPVAALRDLWPLSFRLPFDADRGRAFGGIAELVRDVPIWNLHRPMRIDALSAAVAGIVEGV